MNDVAERPGALPAPVSVYDPGLENFTEKLHETVRRDLASLGTVLDIQGGAVIHSMTRGTVLDKLTITVEHPRLRVPLVLTATYDTDTEMLSYRTAQGRVFEPVRPGYGHGVVGERGREIIDKAFAHLDNHRAITSTEEWQPGMFPRPPKGKELEASGGVNAGRPTLTLFENSTFPVTMPVNTAAVSTVTFAGSTATLWWALPVDPLSFLVMLSAPVAGGLMTWRNRRKDRMRMEHEESARKMENYFENAIIHGLSAHEHMSDDTPNGPVAANMEEYRARTEAAEKLWAEHRAACQQWNQDRFRTLTDSLDSAAEMSVFTDALLALCEEHGVEYVKNLSVTNKVPSKKHLEKSKSDLITGRLTTLRGTIRSYLVGFQGRIDGSEELRWIYFDGYHLFETEPGSTQPGNQRAAFISPL